MPPPAPEVAAGLFGNRAGDAARFVDMLAGEGMQRGLIGPREVSRLWDRHVLNSAALGELIAPGCRVLDVGSGAGLPGVALALARPDLTIALLEPMARRTTWLQEVATVLDLPVEVHRGRAEDHTVSTDWDVVTGRAVAPLGRLAGWCMPLLRPGGQLLAVKGASAREEASRDREEVYRAGGCGIEIVECGASLVDPPATVVIVSRRRGDADRPARRRKDR
ncbi:MAG: 16S rRNA (guanine(527)-N(7))-methyltransferase RsmG [Pseudonocardiaceae bacterium]|nr:16S rRNA (guanine(527)-N(7))-methyltransferase RsmG [Pseudonocardiaceae bacterium]